MDDNLDVEDIFETMGKKKKKGINAKDKGNRTELQLCKLLTERFGQEFTRSYGSGNRWSQVNFMPKHARDTFLGDICCPEGFKWVIECKGGYEKDINLNNLFETCAKLDDFLDQSVDEALRSGRKPILIWKRKFKPWVTMVQMTNMATVMENFNTYIIYTVVNWKHENVDKSWIMVPLEKLLEVTKEDYWFEQVSK